MSHTFWHFLRHRGEMECEITGRRKLANGLEAPCNYHFSGEQKFIDGWLFACFMDRKNLAPQHGGSQFTYCTRSDESCNLQASGGAYMTLLRRVKDWVQLFCARCLNYPWGRRYRTINRKPVVSM